MRLTDYNRRAYLVRRSDSVPRQRGEAPKVCKFATDDIFAGTTGNLAQCEQQLAQLQKTKG